MLYALGSQQAFAASLPQVAGRSGSDALLFAQPLGGHEAFEPTAFLVAVFDAFSQVVRGLRFFCPLSPTASSVPSSIEGCPLRGEVHAAEEGWEAASTYYKPASPVRGELNVNDRSVKDLESVT